MGKLLDPYTNGPDDDPTAPTTISQQDRQWIASEMGPAFVAIGSHAGADAQTFLNNIQSSGKKFNQNHGEDGRFIEGDGPEMLARQGMVQNTLGMGAGTMNTPAVSAPTTIVDPNALPVDKIAEGTLKHLGGALGEGDNPRYSTTVDGQKYFVKALESQLMGLDSETQIQNELTARDIAVAVGLGDQTIPVATFLKDGTNYLTQPWQTGKSGLQIDNWASVMDKVPDELAGKMAAYEYLIGTGDRHEGQYVMDPKTDPSKAVLMNDFDAGFQEGTQMGGTSAFMDVRRSAPITTASINQLLGGQDAANQSASDHGMSDGQTNSLSARFGRLSDFAQSTDSDRTVQDLITFTNYY